MTLIAGFRAYSFPVLLGDLVLSANDQRVGVKKKVHRIAPNCAIAWTGSLFVAEQVFRVLRQRFTGENIRKEELEETLTSLEKHKGESLFVVIIGWLIGEEQFCFRWRSDWPNEIFYGEPLYDGTGDAVIEKFAGPTEIRDKENPNLADLELAVDECLNFTTHRMSMEMSADRNHLTFGHAYEIVYYANSEFHYVDDILYLGLTIQFDEQGKITAEEFSNVVYKYRVFGEYSVTERHEQGIGTEIDVILPLGIESTTEAERLGRSLATNYQFSMASQFYCVFLRFLSPTHVSPPIALIHRANVPKDKRLIEVEDNALLFKLHEPFIRWMHDTIKADAAKPPERD